MNKKNLLLFAMIFFTISACKKKSDSSPTTTTTIEYQITPMNAYFTQIKYNDNSGNQVIVTDPNQITNGMKSIAITTKPFTAKIETTINNTTSSAVNYTLAISVDGQIKNFKEVSAPAGATTTNFVEYIVQ